MDFDELTAEEQILLVIFKKLMAKRGLLHHFYFFVRRSGGLGGFCIYKENGKWVSYIYERGEKCGYREYNDLFSLCMDIFEALDKESTDYCMKEFPLLVDEFLNSQRNGKTR